MHRYCKQKISKTASGKNTKQNFSILHESIDRILSEYKKDSIHNRDDEQMRRVTKQKSMKSLHDLNIVHSERTAHQRNFRLISDNNTKSGTMDSEKLDFSGRKGVSDCLIDNVSSITEKEYDFIQEARDLFPTKEPHLSLQQQERSSEITLQEQNMKTKMLYSDSTQLAEPFESAMQSQSNSKIRNGKSIESTSLSKETDKHNAGFDSYFGFQKKIRPNGEQSNQRMIALGAQHQQNFPHLNKNAILFDQNGRSVDRFIVRSDGIICPVKQVSALSVHPKQHASTSLSRIENEGSSFNAEICFGYGHKRAERMSETREANEGQRGTRRLGREDNRVVDKNQPLQLSKLALQARAFRKFQYMLALRFRRYFLREYLRNRRFQKSNQNNKPETLGYQRSLNTDERLIQTNILHRDLSLPSNVDFSKHSISDIVDGLNLYTTSCSNETGDISGIRSSQMTSSNLLKLFEETPASSLQENGFNLLGDDFVDNLIDDNLCRTNRHTIADTATGRNNDSFDVNAPYPIHPSHSVGHPSHVHALQINTNRFPQNRDGSNEVFQTASENEIFRGSRKESLASQSNSSFQEADQYNQFIRKYPNSFSTTQNNFDTFNSGTERTSLDKKMTATISPYRKPSATFSNVHNRGTDVANCCRTEPTDQNIRTCISRNSLQENEITDALLLSQDLLQPDFFNF